MTSPSVGLSENDLKPVYLMLSSCHTDLAKRAQSSGLASQIREDHRCKAQEYLQKVYGKNTPGDPPVSLAAPQPGRLFNASNLNPTPVASVSENTASPPAAGGPETSTRGPTALEREVDPSVIAIKISTSNIVTRRRQSARQKMILERSIAFDEKQNAK